MPSAPSGPAAAARASLLELLEPVVTGAGFDLEDVLVSQAGRRSLVRVVVDADGGIDLDAVAVVSRVVSDALDAEVDGGRSSVARTLAGSYTLEVTSPGVDRPLTEPRHWRRATGRLVATEVHGRATTGRILEADDDGVLLEVKGRRTRAAWADLGRGRVQIEFNRKAEE